MAQLRRGARQALEYLLADLADIDRLAVDNPAAVRKLAQRIRTRLQEEIEPMLQRAEQPPLEARVKALEDWRAEMEAERAGVVKFRKAE